MATIDDDFEDEYFENDSKEENYDLEDDLKGDFRYQWSVEVELEYLYHFYLLLL